LSRDTASKASPRSNRNTNSIFRCTLQRSGRSSAVAPGVGSLPPGLPFGGLAFIPPLAGEMSKEIGSDLLILAPLCDRVLSVIIATRPVPQPERPQASDGRAAR